MWTYPERNLEDEEKDEDEEQEANSKWTIQVVKEHRDQPEDIFYSVT